MHFVRRKQNFWMLNLTGHKVLPISRGLKKHKIFESSQLTGQTKEHKYMPLFNLHWFVFASLSSKSKLCIFFTHCIMWFARFSQPAYSRCPYACNEVIWRSGGENPQILKLGNRHTRRLDNAAVLNAWHPPNNRLVGPGILVTTSIKISNAKTAPVVTHFQHVRKADAEN
jgi:hypothetical protein